MIDLNLQIKFIQIIRVTCYKYCHLKLHLVSRFSPNQQIFKQENFKQLEYFFFYSIFFRYEQEMLRELINVRDDKQNNRRIFTYQQDSSSMGDSVQRQIIQFF